MTNQSAPTEPGAPAALAKARDACALAEQLRAAGQPVGALAAAALAAQYLRLARLLEHRP